MIKKTILSAIGAICMLLSILSCGGKKEEGPAASSMEQLHAENGKPVSTRQLETEDFSVYLKYPTVAYASSESTAYAALNDVVRTISAKVGDTVRQDDIIVSFSADNQTLSQARLAFEGAKTSYDRASALFRNDDIPRRDFDAAKMQYDIAAANLKAANDMVYVKAPITGIVTQINVRTTENIRPGMPLFTVSGWNGYEARFHVGADEIDRIHTGARAFINDPAENIEGRITQVSLTMDSQKQAFPVTAFFDTDSRALVSGIGVDISVETYRNEKAIVLSRRELIQNDTGSWAFVADGNSVRQVAVRTGEERGLRLEITGGLNAGDMLVSEGARHISAETKINIVPALLAAANN